MDYCFTKKISESFELGKEKTIEALKKEGFSVLKEGRCGLDG